MNFKVVFFTLFIVSHAVANAKEAAVAMPDRFSADVAANILTQGGNAVDAAIAAQFVLAVTLPEAGNIGGGGFMLVRHNGNNDFIDYREKAPLLADKDMYLDENGEVIANKSVYGIFASGVPGTVSGMWLAHQRYANLSWETLLQPAIDLAQQGFVVPDKLAENVHNYIQKINSRNLDVNFADYFAHLKAGDVFKQPELAATLRRIQQQGLDGFYKGQTADHIVKFMNQHGGLINHQDLTQYQAVVRTPINQPWRNFQVLSSPPPSSGGIAIIQWLKMYDKVTESGKKPKHNDSVYMHLLAEAGKRVFADRARYLGDPDFYPVPTSKLLAPDYIAQRAQGISRAQISATEAIKPGLNESEETTHFSIIDAWGNAVANTTTINLSFGSGMVVEGAGFLLNDEMDDLSAKPGVANVFGALGGRANEIEPEKRPLSSMTPTMLLKDGKVFMVTGSPGGTTIISSVYQSLLNVVDYNMSAEQAVNTPRFHHQLWPKDVIRHHPGIKEEVKDALSKMGYSMVERRFGDMHVIISKEGKLDAGSERSGRGKSLVIKVDVKDK
ncbi:gamma-glutamyltransferase [Thalassotalea aquiviva]|uniref:gamma-glutamyltransferase n=1 Tax=Thalassotalea aquiviva TaxID=3242415 RepID=UPI00352BBD50